MKLSLLFSILILAPFLCHVAFAQQRCKECRQELKQKGISGIEPYLIKSCKFPENKPQQWNCIISVKPRAEAAARQFALTPRDFMKVCWAAGFCL